MWKERKIAMGTLDMERCAAPATACELARGMQVVAQAVFPVPMSARMPRHANGRHGGARSKAQFAAASDDILRASTHVRQRITKAPCMALPSSLPYNMSALVVSLELRGRHVLEFVARVGVLRRSKVCGRVARQIKETSQCDDAMLNPRIEWHSTFMSEILRNMHEFIRRMPPALRETCHTIRGGREGVSRNGGAAQGLHDADVCRA